MDIREKLTLARFKLSRDPRGTYLNHILWALNFVPAPGLGTVGVDNKWRLFYDSESADLDSWTVDETVAVLVHEVHHILRNHAGRVFGRDKFAWNLAGDAELNDDLCKEGFTLPWGPNDGKPGSKGYMMPATFGMPEGLTAEEYYKAALEKSKEQQQGDGEPGNVGNGRCGGAVTNETADSDAEGVDPIDQEIGKRRVAADIIAGKKAGHIPGSLVRWAEELLNPTVPWRKELAAKVRRGIDFIKGQQDYTYSRPNFRRKSRYVLPTMQAPNPNVGVVVDTSGSMGQTELSQMLGEVKGILSAVASKKVKVWACDAAAYKIGDVQDARKLKDKLKGGGGTDMGVGITAAVDDGCKVVVVLTDGYTPWPAVCPKGIVVIAGVMGDSGMAQARPDWLKAVKVGD